MEARAGNAKMGCGVTILGVVAILVIVGIYNGGDLSDNSKDPGLQRSSACKAAEDFVERQLVSPGTAKHQSCGARTVSAPVFSSGTTWTVSGYVDSQNRLGGVIRSNYVAVMEDEGKEWRLVDLSVNER